MWRYSTLHSNPFNLKDRQIKWDNHSSKLFGTTMHQQFRGIVDAMLIIKQIILMCRQMGCNRAIYTGGTSNGCKGPIYF